MPTHELHSAPRSYSTAPAVTSSVLFTPALATGVDMALNPRAGAVSYDVLGVSGASLCFVHCAATPLLLTWGPDSGWLGGEATEGLLLVACGLFGLLSLPRSYLRCHGCPEAALLFSAGLGVILMGRFGPVEGLEVWLTPLGAMFVAAAHLWNLRLCRTTP